MAILKDSSTGSNTSVAEDHSNTMSGNTSRKFSGVQKTLVDLSSEVDIKTNNDTIVDHAISLKSMSLVVDNAAKIASEKLIKIRETLRSALESNNSDERRSGSILSEKDILAGQLDNSREIESRLSNITNKTRGFVTKTAEDMVIGGTSSFLPKVNKLTGKVAGIRPPEIESISVDLDKTKGNIDCFFSRLTFSLRKDQIDSGKIVAIRIFRTSIIDNGFMGDKIPMSTTGIQKLTSRRISTKSKNDTSLSSISRQFSDSNVSNAISDLSSVDTFTNVRTSSASSESTKTSILPSKNSTIAGERDAANVASFIDPDVFGGLDSSVINNLKAMRNIQILNPDLVVLSDTTVFPVGQAIGSPKVSDLHDLQINPRASRNGLLNNLLVNQGNSSEFSEIALLTPSRLEGKHTDDNVEFMFEDETISYGKSYRYYVTAIDNNLTESVRSRIVGVSVDGLRIPECPRRVNAVLSSGIVSLAISVDDQLVEKFEIFRKDETFSKLKIEIRNIPIMADALGFTTNSVERTQSANGFIQIGESLNGQAGTGSMFFDRSVLRGRKYTYRVYSVDIFGNKSECPTQADIFIPDPQTKTKDLKTPSIVTEVDSKTNKMKVIFQCDDHRVETLSLSRRDLTISQQQFAPPSQTNGNNISVSKVIDGRTRLEGVKLNEKSWNGIFENEGQQITFLDDTTAIDHTYQYRLIGSDRFGNSTSTVFSKPTLVVRRTFINAPVNVQAVVRYDNLKITGVDVSWENGDIDVSAEDKLGSRDSLKDSEVRTLYQVERRLVGSDAWSEFVLTENTTMFDKLEQTGIEKPPFRPDFVKLNQKYIYRIEALQTGSFISNFSRPTEVFVGFPVLIPSNFRLRACDTKCRPFYVMLNWDTNPFSGDVDRWEIERVEVNNYIASRINTNDTRSFNKLQFEKFRTVYRESSRFRSITIDDDSVYSGQNKELLISANAIITKTFDRQLQETTQAKPISVSRGNGTIVGNHHFMDTNVNFGNTYFYRIRSVSTENSVSGWTYKGIKITDSLFEKKLESILTQDEKLFLSKKLVPLIMKSDELITKVNPSDSSFSLQPSFSKPNSSTKISKIKT